MGSAAALRELLKNQTQRFTPGQQDLSQQIVAIVYVHPSTAACRAQPGRGSGRGLRVKPQLLSALHHPTLTVSQGCITETYFYLLYIQNCATSPMLWAVLQGNLDAAGCCLELSCATGMPQICPHPAQLLAKPLTVARAKAQGPLPALLGPCPGRDCISAL